MRNLVVIDDEQKYRDIIAEIAGGVLSKRAPGEWDVLAPNTLDEALDAVLDTRRDAGIVLIDGTLNTAGYQALKDPWASVREFENTRGWQVADHIKHDRPDTVRVSLNGSLHMGNHTDLEIKNKTGLLDEGIEKKDARKDLMNVIRCAVQLAAKRALNPQPGKVAVRPAARIVI